MSVQPHTHSFKNLSPGDCFALGELYFVKLATPVIVKWSGLYAHAIELGKGEPTTFHPDDQVTLMPRARIVTDWDVFEKDLQVAVNNG